MSGTISTRWYFTDWMSDEGVRASSLGARGLWMDLLCIAGTNAGSEHGFVLIAGKKPSSEQLARRLGSTVAEVDALLTELAENKVFSRDRRGVIYSRRMVKTEINRRNGRLGGNPNLLKNKENPKPVQLNPKPLIPLPIPVPIRKREEDSERKTPCGSASQASDWPADYQETFWAIYPRRTEKKAALAKLDVIRRSGEVAWSRLEAGLRRHAARSRGKEERYIKHPTTWLNRGCWDDESVPDAPAKARNGFVALALGLNSKMEEIVDGEPDDGEIGERTVSTRSRSGNVEVLAPHRYRRS